MKPILFHCSYGKWSKSKIEILLDDMYKRKYRSWLHTIFRGMICTNVNIAHDYTLSSAGAATSNNLVATNMSFVATRVCLSRQMYLRCILLSFVATRVCLSRQMYLRCILLSFVATRVCLSRQMYLRCILLSFVATRVCLSRQMYLRCILLSFVATWHVHNKSFVATKTILVAAPANDNTHKYVQVCSYSRRVGGGGGGSILLKSRVNITSLQQSESWLYVAASDRTNTTKQYLYT